MSITLAPELEARAQQVAQHEGITLDQLVNEILEEYLDLPGVNGTEELFGGNQPYGPAEGESKPLSVYLAEQRRKYGYPESWPTAGSSVEAEPGVFEMADK